MHALIATQTVYCGGSTGARVADDLSPGVWKTRHPTKRQGDMDAA